MTDDAFVTPVMMLRPSSFGRGDIRARAALVVRFPGDAQIREVVLRGLLGQGWQLVAPPVGEFEFKDGLDCRVHIADGGVQVEAAGETVFDGELPLTPDLSGYSWFKLARAMGEVLVFVTVGRQPILTAEDAEDTARAGHLVGLSGTLLGDSAH